MSFNAPHRILHSFGKMIWFVFAKKMHVRACFRLLFTVTDYTFSWCVFFCWSLSLSTVFPCSVIVLLSLLLLLSSFSSSLLVWVSVQLCFLFQFEQAYHVQRFSEFVNIFVQSHAHCVCVCERMVCTAFSQRKRISKIDRRIWISWFWIKCTWKFR